MMATLEEGSSPGQFRHAATDRAGVAAQVDRRGVMMGTTPTLMMAETPAGLLTLPDGATVPYRPIRPEDAPALQRFHARLSENSIYFRFFGFLRTLSDEMARYFTHVDGSNRVALVALDPADAETIIGVVRFDRDTGTDEAEYAAVVTDRWQGRGLGTALTRELIAAARERGITHLYAIVLPGNERMLHLFHDLQIPEHAALEDGGVRVDLDLSRVETA
jgi:RimJ/RimL family protein N-acetyltransferase